MVEKNPLDALPDLLQEARASRLRLRSKVNEDNERIRTEDTLWLLERLLERYAVLVDPASAGEQPPADAITAVRLGSEYLLDLAARREKRWEKPGDDVGTVIAPGEAGAYLASLPGGALEGSTRRYLENAVAAAGAGLVEVGTAEHGGTAPEFPPLRSRRSPRAVQEPASLQMAKLDREEQFRWQLGEALRTGGPLNVNNANHVEITRVLAEAVERRESGAPASLRIAYADGSEAAPFPVRCLAPVEPCGEVVLKASLMSMRHLLLDSEVTFNWLRNREVDQATTLARSDQYCYDVSVRQLDELFRADLEGKRLLLYLFHTGFEPAVVGFYRALAESIAANGPWIRVQPQFFIEDGRFLAGPSWPRIRS